ncbi:Protein of unknown function DUF111 [Acetitomaculum ruminis DSM 5522]|uniref:DUF111 family protein n=1 Tax=Acetitomaculum ruminis DSM 5522 TaxID=1120918 RepID=A0A1I0VRH0_9FIRM|nr:nickel insertion protein [Acetitomaculum ruminis]SFA79009.1 Protein of unknown function DUF111 [Acetitomaculum ruminis DSM 5522]
MGRKVLYFDCSRGISLSGIFNGLYQMNSKQIEFMIEILEMHEGLTLSICDGFIKAEFNKDFNVDDLLDETFVSRSVKEMYLEYTSKVEELIEKCYEVHENGKDLTVMDKIYVLAILMVLEKNEHEKVMFSSINDGTFVIGENDRLKMIPETLSLIVSKQLKNVNYNITQRKDSAVSFKALMLADLISTSVDYPICSTVIRNSIATQEFYIKFPIRVIELIEEEGEEKQVRGDELSLQEQPVKVTHSSAEDIWVIETNIDDSSGEVLGYAMEKLIYSGARDAFYTPIFMKKSRPAYKLEVICDYKNVDALVNVIFRETTSIGVRMYPINRVIMNRKNIRTSTKYGTIQVKQCSYQDIVKNYPEYNSVRDASIMTGASFQEIYDETKKSLDN